MYKLTVKVGDTTTNAYCDFVNQVLSAYNDYLDYVAEAKQICSYNNITNSYNQFFIDKINEIYDHKPWVRAAYYAVGVSDMLFGGPSAISEEAYREAVIREVMKIAPETGNLSQTIEFARIFNTLLQYIAGIEPIEGAELAPGGAEETPATSFGTSTTFKEYTNEVPITKEIFGDIAPDLLGDDDIFAIRDTVPLPVVKEGWSETYPYGWIDRSGTDSDSEYDPILWDISESKKIKYIWERVFLMGFGGYTMRLMFPFEPMGFPYDGTMSYESAFESVVTTQMTNRVIKYDYELDERIEAEAYTTGGTTVYYTGMTYVLHRILKSFTTDVEFADTGTRAKRKSSGTAPAGSTLGMRQYRTGNQVLYILKNYILPETNRRIAASGHMGSMGSYTDSDLASWLASKRATSSYPEYYSAYIHHEVIPRIVKTMVEWMISYIEFRAPGGGGSEILDGSVDSGGTIGGTTGGGIGMEATADRAKFYSLLREDNKWGSDSFNSAIRPDSGGTLLSDLI